MSKSSAHIASLLTHYTRKLSLVSDHPKADAQSLICYVLNVTPSYLYTWPEKVLTLKQQQLLEDLIQQRLTGKPIAYIVGKQGFWSLTLNVNKHTLIPRSDTECLVEDILSHHPKTQNLNVLDLGTGSGAIALALGLECSNWSITATDISHGALAIAQDNAAVHNITNVKFINSNWYVNIKGYFDLIISNPPYIAQDDPRLCPQVKDFEPSSALIAKDNGLADLIHIITHAPKHLKTGGQLILEHGFQQAQNVADIFAKHGFNHIEHIKDLSGHFRATKANLS